MQLHLRQFEMVMYSFLVGFFQVLNVVKSLVEFK